MKRFALFAIIWGMAGMAGTTYTNWYDSSHGTEVKFRVQGYDPRDLLAGHYLTYRVDYGSRITCGQFSNDLDYINTQHCLCLTVDNAGVATAATGATESCAAIKESCSLWLKGQCQYNDNFQAQIERFYIPEGNRADNITTSENAQITVRISKSGRGMVTGLLR
jgi:uncharacterized membrane-anchored protein